MQVTECCVITIVSLLLTSLCYWLAHFVVFAGY